MKHVIFWLSFSAILLSSAIIFTELEAKEIELGYDNTIILSGPVDDVMEQNFIKDAARIMTDGPKKINVVIFTNGGSQYISQNIADILKKYSASKEISIISLKAYSGGYMIHQLSGGSRYALKTSTLMWHNPFVRDLSGTFMSVMMFMQRWAAELDVLLPALQKRTNMNYELFIQHMNATTHYTADQALQFGIIDDIVTIKCEKNFIQCDYVLTKHKANQ